MRFVDTHCHLHDATAFADPEPEIEAARAAGVDRIVVVGVNPADWDIAIEFADRYEGVFAILGWHPNYTADYDPATLQRLEELLGHPKVRALGEIGLDYYWEYAPQERQFEALRDQLDLATSLNMPTVFHARDAYGAVLDILEKRGPAQYLLHCFAGDHDDARRAIQLGATIGIDGPITYKKAEVLRQIAGEYPLESIVLETDSPYMAPVPFRGKQNSPAKIPLIAQALADARQMELAAVADATTANAERYFGL